MGLFCHFHSPAEKCTGTLQKQHLKPSAATCWNLLRHAVPSKFVQTRCLQSARKILQGLPGGLVGSLASKRPHCLRPNTTASVIESKPTLHGNKFFYSNKLVNTNYPSHNCQIPRSTSRNSGRTLQPLFRSRKPRVRDAVPRSLGRAEPGPAGLGPPAAHHHKEASLAAHFEQAVSSAPCTFQLYLLKVTIPTKPSMLHE